MLHGAGTQQIGIFSETVNEVSVQVEREAESLGKILSLLIKYKYALPLEEKKNLRIILKLVLEGKNRDHVV